MKRRLFLATTAFGGLVLAARSSKRIRKQCLKAKLSVRNHFQKHPDCVRTLVKLQRLGGTRAIASLCDSSSLRLPILEIGGFLPLIKAWNAGCKSAWLLEAISLLASEEAGAQQLISLGEWRLLKHLLDIEEGFAILNSAWSAARRSSFQSANFSDLIALASEQCSCKSEYETVSLLCKCVARSLDSSPEEAAVVLESRLLEAIFPLLDSEETPTLLKKSIWSIADRTCSGDPQVDPSRWKPWIDMALSLPELGSSLHFLKTVAADDAGLAYLQADENIVHKAFKWLQQGGVPDRRLCSLLQLLQVICRDPQSVVHEKWGLTACILPFVPPLITVPSISAFGEGFGILEADQPFVRPDLCGDLHQLVQKLLRYDFLGWQVDEGCSWIKRRDVCTASPLQLEASKMLAAVVQHLPTEALQVVVQDWGMAVLSGTLDGVSDSTRSRICSLLDALFPTGDAFAGIRAQAGRLPRELPLGPSAATLKAVLQCLSQCCCETGDAAARFILHGGTVLCDVILQRVLSLQQGEQDVYADTLLHVAPLVVRSLCNASGSLVSSPSSSLWRFSAELMLQDPSSDSIRSLVRLWTGAASNGPCGDRWRRAEALADGKLSGARFKSFGIRLQSHLGSLQRQLEADRPPCPPYYPEGVHVLHASKNSAGYDLVFVHGLMGGAFSTWRLARSGDHAFVRPPSPLAEPLAGGSPHECWPALLLPPALGDDIGRILSVSAASSLSLWNNQLADEHSYREASTAEHGRRLFERLRSAGVGNRPVVFVCHSLGGLVVKSMLIHAAKQQAGFGLAENTKGVVFLAVPQFGSPLAARHPWLIRRAARLTPVIEALQPGSPELLKLNVEFCELYGGRLRMLSLLEGKETVVGLGKLKQSSFVVPPPFGRLPCGPESGEEIILPWCDHIALSKPLSAQDPRCKPIISFISDTIGKSTV